MDSGIQLSIRKFQPFKRDRIKWFSPQEAHTHGFAALWVPLFMSVEFDGANTFWNAGSIPLAERHHQPLAPQGTLQTPHNFNQHRKTSNPKDQRASASASKCTVMTNSLSVFLRYSKENQHIRLFSLLPGGGGGGTELAMPHHHLPHLRSHSRAKESSDGTGFAQLLCAGTHL